MDDNFFACSNWREIIEEIESTGKRFQFKQGLDERLLTPEKVRVMQKWKYDGDFIFAFDNIEDKNIIIDKMEMLYLIVPDWKKQMKFYCFCGFDRQGKYDYDFWVKDIKELFDRFFILAKYSAHPYVMRHENYKKSPFFHLYDAIAAYANQPSIYATFDFETFCKCRGMKPEGYKKYKRDVEGYLKEYKKKNAPKTRLGVISKILLKIIKIYTTKYLEKDFKFYHFLWHSMANIKKSDNWDAVYMYAIRCYRSRLYLKKFRKSNLKRRKQ